jgi:hypothetical protein
VENILRIKNPVFVMAREKILFGSEESISKSVIGEGFGK